MGRSVPEWWGTRAGGPQGACGWSQQWPHATSPGNGSILLPSSEARPPGSLWGPHGTTMSPWGPLGQGHGLWGLQARPRGVVTLVVWWWACCLCPLQGKKPPKQFFFPRFLQPHGIHPAPGAVGFVPRFPAPSPGTSP